MREYAPLVGWIAAWVIITAAVGSADAARLFAATIFVRSARALTGASVVLAIRRRIGASLAVRRATLRMSLIVEAGTLVGSIVMLAGVLAVLGAGDPRAASLCLIVASGLAAHYLLPFAASRNYYPVYASARTWSSAALAAGAWAGGLGAESFAIILAMREWLGLATALLFATPVTRDKSRIFPADFTEIATLSFARGRRRLTYRLGKGLLSTVFGPFGTIAARTGRTMGADRSLQHLTPREPRALALLAMAAAAPALALLLLVPRPITMLVAASLLNIAAAAANVLLWRWLSGASTGGDNLDADED